MTETPETPTNYYKVGETVDGYPIHLWWVATDSDCIHETCSDPRWHDAKGGKPGWHRVFSCNPKSADYKPADFNRSARVLREAGKPAPEYDVPEHRRQLSERPEVIAKILSSKA